MASSLSDDQDSVFSELGAMSAGSRSHDEQLDDNYADAFTDLYGTAGCAPCIVKTGPRWMRAPRGPHTSHLRRELWPVHDPALVGEWPHIVRSTATYFDSIPQPLVLVAGYAVANAGDLEPFCRTILDIGVPPNSIAFDVAKKAAEDVKSTIIAPSFSAYEIDVMITERPGNHLLAYRLRGLRPEDYPIDSYHHTFTSTPSLAIAPLNLPGVEGTTSVFYHREGDKKDVLAITACHVACGLPASPNGTSHLEPGREIVHLGPVAFAKAESDILRRLVTIDSQVKGYKQVIKRLEDSVADGKDPYGVEASIERMQHQIVPLNEVRQELDELHRQVRTSPVLEGRVIGNVLHADPIAEGPEGHTVDWAAIKVAKESVDWETFLGNKVYVGDVPEPSYEEMMSSEHATGEYPDGGLLAISGIVPKGEIGDDMPVVKNGMASGTTCGRVNGLRTLQRYYSESLNFQALEITILGHPSMRDGFSKGGDSGAVILDGAGRAVGLLTGGPVRALNKGVDFTYATPFYEIERRIKEVFPNYVPYQAAVS